MCVRVCTSTCVQYKHNQREAEVEEIRFHSMFHSKIPLPKARVFRGRIPSKHAVLATVFLSSFRLVGLLLGSLGSSSSPLDFSQNRLTC